MTIDFFTKYKLLNPGTIADTVSKLDNFMLRGSMKIFKVSC